MSKVLSNPLIYDIVPKTIDIQVVKSIAMQNEIVVGGLIKKLGRHEKSILCCKINYKTWFINYYSQHNVGNTLSYKKKFCALGVHHHKFCNAMAKAYGFE